MIRRVASLSDSDTRVTSDGDVVIDGSLQREGQVACGLLTARAMRIAFLFFVITLFSCAPTADEICKGVALGTPIKNVWGASSTPDTSEFGCGASRPQRDPQGPVTELRCCMRGTSEQCNTDCSKHGGAELFRVGPTQVDDFNLAQCCAVVQDGKVAARYVAHD